MGVVSQYLKRKGLAYSAATWSDLFAKRLQPALENKSLSRGDLLAILNEVEEFGQQHVFLFQTQKSYASQLTNSNYIRPQLKKLGREDLMDKPPVIAHPTALTLAGVRLEPVNGVTALGVTALVIKAIELRSYRRFVSEQHDGNFITRLYEQINERAVNVLRVHSDGFAELRIQSHQNSSDYKDDVQAMWSLCNPIVSALKFSPLSIGNVKQYLWERRQQFRHKIRYSDSRLRNSAGTVLAAATGPVQASLYDDPGAAASLDLFIKGDAICDKTNVFWLKGANGTPSRDIHILMDGDVNEFVVTAQCSKPDYEWVLSEIKNANA